MSEWKARRFWKVAAVVETDGGFAVELDSRPVRTPAKALLVLPTRNLAKAVSAEWDAQEGQVDPLSMPFTRSANAAIDKVAAQREEVIDMIAEYGGSDLICYRAKSPPELAERQALNWNPLLAFSEEQLGAPLQSTVGVVHKPQQASSLKRLRDHVAALSDFELTAFHDLVSLSGSLVIGFAVTRKFADAESLWHVSRIDELWQQEQWGEDEEAVATAEVKRTAFLHAERFFFLSR